MTMNGVLIALGHAFFSLSLASGVMMIYGAYLPNNVSIVRTSIWIALADTSVALIAGMVIYPIVFGQGLDAGQGPGLIFVTLPIAFGSMPGGALIGTLFFLMLVFAALLEAFPRQLVDGTESRFLIGGVMLIFWLAYFILYRPAAAQETA